MQQVRVGASLVYLERNSEVTTDPPPPACLLLPMKPSTDYIRHAARLSRKLQMDAAMGSAVQPDAEFYKALSKALEEIAAGLEQVAPRE